MTTKKLKPFKMKTVDHASLLEEAIKNDEHGLIEPPHDYLRVSPLPDGSGDPDTLGTRWSWTAITLPFNSVKEFGPSDFKTKKAAQKAALEIYPDLEVVEE